MSNKSMGADHPFFKMVDTIIKNVFRDLESGEIDYDATITLLNRQLDIAEKNNLYELQGRIHHVMGILSAERGYFQTGRGHFQAGMEVYQLTDFKSGISTMLCCLGELCRELGEVTESAQYFHQSREIAEEIDRTYMVIYNYGNEGQLWLSIGEIERGLNLLQIGLEMAIETIQTNWNEDIVYALMPEMRIAIAEGYARQEKFTEAWAEITEAIRPAQERNNIQPLAKAHQVMAIIAIAEKKPTETIMEYFAQSRDYWQKMEASLDLAQTLTLEGDFWVGKDDKKRATTCYTEALSHYEQANKMDEANVLRAKISE